MTDAIQRLDAADAVAPDDQRFVFVRLLNPQEPDRIVVIEKVTRTGPAGSS